MNYIYYSISILGLISGLIVVSAINPVHRIANLVIVFIVGAFIFMLLDYYFLGLVYIIVYVGALAILFLFIIMLVQISIVEPDNKNIETPLLTPSLFKNKSNIYTSNLLFSLINSFIPFFILFVVSIFFVLQYNPSLLEGSISNINIFNTSIYSYFYPVWSIEYKYLSDLETLGIITYVGYPLALVFIGLALWVVMIGIISICSNRNI